MTAQEAVRAGLARTALGGFFLSGILFSFLGAILPAWGHHLTEDFLTVGNYFLSLSAGMLLSPLLARFLFSRRSTSFLLAIACCLAFAGFAFLAAAPPALESAWWRIGGIAAVGAGAGLLNVGLFQAISPLYRQDPATTINLGGAFFGMGCVLASVLVAGTFYIYTAPSILIFIALIPGFFAISFAKTPFREKATVTEPSLGQAISDFRSPVAVLFAMLLFFQFGNEWAIAGWLPLFLTQRVGVSPATSLMVLALYWTALLVGRTIAMWLLPRVSHGRLLTGGVLMAVLGCAILMFTDNRFGASAGALFAGGGFAPVYPLVVERIGGRFPYYHPGFFNGIFSLGLTGGLLAPWSLGLFTHLWGIQVVMVLPLLGTIMVLLLLLLIWAETKFAGVNGWKGDAEL